MIKQAVIETLQQGIDLLEGMTQQDYQAPVSAAYNATIGGHYRHQLEHFSMLLENYSDGSVNYDHRGRDTSVENCNQTALDTTKQLVDTISSLDDSTFDSPIKVHGKICLSTDESMNTESTFGREAAFAISHANHHFAIIGIMCNLLNLDTQDHFGVAPSTVKHRADLKAQQASC